MEASKEKKQALTSLKTARGQIDGIIKMLEDSRYCIDISNQIMAAQSLLSKANKLILVSHLQTCVKDSADNPEQMQEKTDELINVLSKLLK